MLKERNQTFKLMFIGLDLAISFLGFWAAFLLRYFLDTNFYFNTTNYVILSIVLSVTQVLAFISIDLYHPRRGLSFFDELVVIATGVVLNLLFILSLLFFFRGEIRGESFSRLFVGYYVVTSIMLTAIIHYVFRIFLMRLRERGYNLRNVIIIGTGKTAERITDVIQNHKIYGYNIVGYIKSIARTKAREDFPILGNLKDIEQILSGQRPDILIYAKEFADGENLREIIDICDHENIELKIIPEFIEFIAAKGRVEGMDGVPIISIRDIPIRMGYNRFIKRSFDFLFALIFILVFSPIYILIAFLVKVTSEGDIFIRQERVGLDNKSFPMLKFRTMYTQAKADSDTIWTKKNDPRVTPVGGVLRKLSLDEIPQFFNVLMGSMSVVGPRPERPFFVEKFKNEHRQYMRRHAVKAGITGWAQVNGLRGDTSIEKRIEADIYYIENWSIFFDLKIILLTPLTGLINKNAY